MKEFRFVSADVLPNVDDECPQGTKAIVIPGGISARSELEPLLPVGEDPDSVKDSIIIDSLNK